MSSESLNLTLRVWRQDSPDTPGRFEHYQLNGVSTHMSFLEMLDVLNELKPNPTPLLVSDLLARFGDEDNRRVDELFFQCQLELQRLSQCALLFVSAQARPPLERLGAALSRASRACEYSSDTQTTGNTDGPYPAPLFPAI